MYIVVDGSYVQRAEWIYRKCGMCGFSLLCCGLQTYHRMAEVGSALKFFSYRFSMWLRMLEESVDGAKQDK